MSEKTVSVRIGTPIIGLLGVAFVILKLCGVINWSWWLVTLPFWGGLALVLSVLLLMLVAAGVLSLAGAVAKKKRR